MKSLKTLLAAATLTLAACAAHPTVQLPAPVSALPAADDNDGKSFRSLAFHDIRPKVRQSFETDPSEPAVDEQELLNLFSWMQQHDYHPVSLQQVIDARSGGKPLPPRPVLLSFDDGYKSLYTRAFPLLRQFRYPAVVALETGWLSVPANQQVLYGEKRVPRSNFVDWDELREMKKSGLIEFASHTHDLHHGLYANPQGNLEPAVVAYGYNVSTKTYESAAQYRDRITADFKRSKQEIESQLGVKVRAMVWPYGAYNEAAVRASKDAGMPYTLTLDDGGNTPEVPLDRIHRVLATYELSAEDYEALLRAPAACCDARENNRVMQIDLDYVYDPDPAQQEANLGKLLDRVLAIGPDSVFLQAFSDPDGDGAAESLYFPNRRMPMRADLFNRVSWQLRTRCRVKVYAWMPVTAFKLADLAQVQANPPAREGDTRIPRLSVFDERARGAIKDIYADLSQQPMDGVLFHDDARLQDDEDASPAALKAYESMGLPGDIAAIRADAALSQKWAQAKTQALIDFTLQLAAILRTNHPELLTARNLYAGPVLDPAQEAWFAQSLPAYVKAYNYTALMAMPYMEGVKGDRAAEKWLAKLADKVRETPGAADRVIFELQSYDWARKQPVDDKELSRQFALLHSAGLRHLGYYPDDFINGRPGLAAARDALSIRRYPDTPIDAAAQPQARPVTNDRLTGDRNDEH